MNESELPVESPICRHSWRWDIQRLAWICHCGYTIPQTEIDSYREGDARLPPSETPEGTETK